jgi:hypothetical protein
VRHSAVLKVASGSDVMGCIAALLTLDDGACPMH